jgi:catechol 2,3-dioxygenase-like lactoylglutathione lyase family enzyme
MTFRRRGHSLRPWGSPRRIGSRLKANPTTSPCPERFSIGIGTVGAAGDDRFGFWVYVDDVDIAFERLRASGAPVVADPEDQPWGERVARIRDPGGHLVYLGAAL